MATPRLPFLWPEIFKAVERSAVRSPRAAARFQHLQQHPRRQAHSAPQKRYGSANEPLVHLGGGKSLGPSTTGVDEEQVNKALPKIGEKLQQDGEAEVKAQMASTTGSKVQPEIRQSSATVDGQTPAQSTQEGKTSAPTNTKTAQDKSASAKGEEGKPVESLLDSIPHPTQKDQPGQNPSEKEAEAAVDEHSPPIRAPHIDPPRYVHHFDTYGLVRHLAEGGLSEDQAITLMKAVRVRLADNMGLAKEALVSKSMVENETYLFRAACAELKTEVTSRRKAEQEKMRTERTQLQHEVDILSQRMGQENAAMKDELKGMFDDRKMAVRNEQREMESRLQQINYKITVELQADAKSEVEGLRWVMTRRVIIALVSVVVMVLGSLKLSSDVARDGGEGKKRGKVKMVSEGVQTMSEQQPVSALTQGDVVVRDGSNSGYVSLG